MTDDLHKGEFLEILQYGVPIMPKLGMFTANPTAPRGRKSVARKTRPKARRKAGGKRVPLGSGSVNVGTAKKLPTGPAGSASKAGGLRGPLGGPSRSAGGRAGSAGRKRKALKRAPNTSQRARY